MYKSTSKCIIQNILYTVQQLDNRKQDPLLLGTPSFPPEYMNLKDWNLEQTENLLGLVCAMLNPINGVLEQIIRNIPSNLYLIITIIYPVNTNPPRSSPTHKLQIKIQFLNSVHFRISLKCICSKYQFFSKKSMKYIWSHSSLYKFLQMFKCYSQENFKNLFTDFVQVCCCLK